MKKTADKRTKKPHFKIDFSSVTLTLSPKSRDEREKCAWRWDHWLVKWFFRELRLQLKKKSSASNDGSGLSRRVSNTCERENWETRNKTRRLHKFLAFFPIASLVPMFEMSWCWNILLASRASVNFFPECVFYKLVIETLCSKHTVCDGSER